MSDDPPLPPLKLLHPEDCLIPLKLQQRDGLSTDVLVRSLAPGQRECLKTRQDDTIIDGNHRIYVLRKRSVDVDALPREIILKEEF